MLDRLRNRAGSMVVAMLVLFAFRAIAAPVLCADHGDATRAPSQASAAVQQPADADASHHDAASVCDADPSAPAGAAAMQAKPSPAIDEALGSFGRVGSPAAPTAALDPRLIPARSGSPAPRASPWATAPRLRI